MARTFISRGRMVFKPFWTLKGEEMTGFKLARLSPKKAVSVYESVMINQSSYNDARNLLYSLVREAFHLFKEDGSRDWLEFFFKGIDHREDFVLCSLEEFFEKDVRVTDTRWLEKSINILKGETLQRETLPKTVAVMYDSILYSGKIFKGEGIFSFSSILYTIVSTLKKEFYTPSKDGWCYCIKKPTNQHVIELLESIQGGKALYSVSPDDDVFDKAEALCKVRRAIVMLEEISQDIKS